MYAVSTFNNPQDSLVTHPHLLGHLRSPRRCPPPRRVSLQNFCQFQVLIYMIFIQSKYIEIQTEVNSLDNDLAVHLLVVQTWVTFRPPELSVGVSSHGMSSQQELVS